MLFVTWDGPQVTYLESLFLPIFRGLKAYGIETDVLQFRWGTDARGSALRAACMESECRYREVPVIRRGSAAGPFLTALAGGWHVRKAIRDFGSEVLMPRSLMPALATLSGPPLKIPILFDSDGLAADEKVEFGGLSPTGFVYRAFRSIEASMVRRASAVLVRTEKASEILSERASVDHGHFTVVANGRDEKKFRPLDIEGRLIARRELGLPAGAPLLVYAGSVGPQYRFDLIRSVTTAMRDRCPSARLLILTGQPDDAKLLLGNEVSQVAIVRSVPPSEVPRYLAAADVGLAFRATDFSTQAIAPIKLGEYLLCGLPVIGTAHIGDTAPAISGGVFYDASTRSISDAAAWVEDTVLAERERLGTIARMVGLDRFSLRRSVEDYYAAVRSVADRESKRRHAVDHKPSATG